MNEIWRTLLPCAALALGEALGLGLPSSAAQALPAAAFLALVLVLAYAGWRRKWCGFLAIAAVGFTLALNQSGKCREQLRAFEGGGNAADVSVCVEGRVRVVEASGGNRWASFSTHLAGRSVKVVCERKRGEMCPSEGEVWRCAGWLGKDERVRTLWVKGRGTFARRERKRGALDDFRLKLRHDLSRRMGIGLSHNPLAADLNRAILLGERALVARDVRQTFADAGTMHLFAVSGLHVALVAGVAGILLLWLPLRLRVLGILVVVWAYVLLVGGAPSAARAGAMITVFSSSVAFNRRGDGLAAWRAAFLLFHLVNPMLLHDVGSLLSFTVMLGILVALRIETLAHSRLPQFLSVSTSAWAAGAPIGAYVFSRITPGGLFANILLIPMAAVSVTAGLFGILASYLSETLCSHLNNLSALATSAMLAVSAAVARIPGANFDLSSFPLASCVVWYAAMIAVLALRLWLARRARARII